MNTEEYAAQQAVISGAVVRYVLQFGQLFIKPALTLGEWLSLLTFLFPTVEFHRRNSAELARSFYDSERFRFHPDLPRNDMFLEGYSFEQFVKDMDPARERISRIDSPPDAVGQLAAHAVRAVENGGRRQIIHAVEDDSVLAEIQDSVVQVQDSRQVSIRDLLGETIQNPQSQQQQKTVPTRTRRVVRGWSRVATGRETCAWCLMLISRGPVYRSASNAGLHIPDKDAAAIWGDTGYDLDKFLADTTPHVEQWHANCDCKVVPVFDQEDWPGRSESLDALELWKVATLQAAQELELEPDSTHDYGSKAGKRLTHNELALNALRRGLYDGQINAEDYSATTTRAA